MGLCVGACVVRERVCVSVFEGVCECACMGACVYVPTWCMGACVSVWV